MSDINKFTSKEVLNKVLLDSSGNAVEAFSHTTQEALNAALDATNNRLNVSLAGGTISGDVTISGDLTVSGGGSLAFDEILEGTQVIDVTDTEAFLVRKDSDNGDVFKVDTTNSRVNVGTPTGTGIFEVKGSVDNDYAGRFENTHSGGYGALVKIAGTTANDLAFQVRADSTNILTINGDSSATFAGTINTTLSSTGIIGDLKNTHASGYGLKIQATDANSARYIATFNDKDDNMKARIFGDGGATFSGDVAIGDSVPLARLHVQGSSSGAVQAFIINTNGATNSSADLAFGNWSGAIPTGTGNPGPQAKISAINTDSGTAATDLVFSTYGSAGTSSEKMRITNAGVVELTSGQLKFPASQSASSDANTLDDYEEGTYTVTLTPSTSGSITVNSSYDTASYTKIGRQVTVTGAIDTSAISSPVGFIKVNVPFAIGANTELSHRASGSVVVYSASSNIQDYMVFADGGEAYFRIYLSTGTTLTTTSAATIDASTSIAFTFTYFA